MLDLEFLASDSGGFVPVYFSNVNRAIGKANACDAFALAPATEAIDPPQARDLTDRGAVAKVSIPEISPRISKRIL